MGNNVKIPILNHSQMKNLKHWALLKKAKQKHGIIVPNVDTSTSIVGILGIVQDVETALHVAKTLFFSVIRVK